MRRVPSGWSPALRVAAIARGALAYALWPIFPVIAAAAAPACRGELRARPLHRRDQPRSGRPRGDRRAARAQRALCLDRQRRRGRRDGRGRLFLLAAWVFFVTAALLDPRLACAWSYPPGAKSIRSSRMAALSSDKPDHAPAPFSTIIRKRAAVHSRRAACCCSTSPMPRCCR